MAWICQKLVHQTSVKFRNSNITTPFTNHCVTVTSIDVNKFRPTGTKWRQAITRTNNDPVRRLIHAVPGLNELKKLTMSPCISFNLSNTTRHLSHSSLQIFPPLWESIYQGWGLLSQFSPFRFFSFFSNDQNSGYLYDIKFVFGRCHHSCAAETPGKYEHD